MSQFRFHGIAEALAAQVRSSMRSPQYGHPAHRELAQGYGPCRLCLRPAGASAPARQKTPSPR
jgi:hypothetical protein